MLTLFEFNLTKFVKVCEGAKVERTEHKYQMPALDLPSAMFKMGCTFNSYELHYKEAGAIAYCESEENAKAIIIQHTGTVNP